MKIHSSVDGHPGCFSVGSYQQSCYERTCTNLVVDTLSFLLVFVNISEWICWVTDSTFTNRI